MTAQEKALEYAKQHNHYNMTNEEFFGKMVVDGIVISRTPNSTVCARARRDGKTIIITETTKTTIPYLVDGNKMLHREEETTVEIMRIDL